MWAALRFCAILLGSLPEKYKILCIDIFVEQIYLNI